MRRSLGALSEGDDDNTEEVDPAYRALPWGSSRSPAAVAEDVARVLATDPELRATAQVCKESITSTPRPFLRVQTAFRADSVRCVLNWSVGVVWIPSR